MTDKNKIRNKKFDWRIFIICMLIVYAIAFLGSIFTSSNTSSAWYSSIKPSITPQNFVFPIVWNILFFLIGLSLYFAWFASGKSKSKKAEKKSKGLIMIFFGINFFLNILWSFLFFTMKLPVAAFFELLVLWLSILALILINFKIKKLSSYLLIPYAAWVAFAGILNGIIAFS